MILREIITRIIFGLIIGLLTWGLLVATIIGFPPTHSYEGITYIVISILIWGLPIIVGIAPILFYLRSKK